MPLARLLRASPIRSARHARPRGPDAPLDGDLPRGRGPDDLDLLASAFDACFSGELDTDWEQLAAPAPGRAS